jgi:undecaprenyl-diphosphatase
MCIVEWLWRGTRRPAIRRTAVTISWLGNGSIYVLLALLLMAIRPGAWLAVTFSILCMLLAHLVYPWVKAACARDRPCELHLQLEPLLCSLDRHSFPSGHAMTLTAALVPVLAAFPDLWLAALGLWLAMAWSRIACAHHYPSDVLAGALLGLTVAAPVTLAASAWVPAF